MIYFTSDTHFGHANIIKYCNRPFLCEADKQALSERGGTWHDGDWKGNRSSKWHISAEATKMMDDTIIDNINKMVGANDTLYHLGDFCFAPKHNYLRVAEEYRIRIKCKNIHFIFGNHDRYEVGRIFSSCYNMDEVKTNGVHIILCHYAMASFNKSHRGAWQLYGHSHSNAESWLNSVMPGRRSIDVGVDNAAKILGEYRPFSFNELQELIGKNPGFSPDHHRPASGPTEEELVDF